MYYNLAKKSIKYLVVLFKGSTFAPAFGKGAAMFE